MSVIVCFSVLILSFVSAAISQNYYEENMLNEELIYPPSISPTEPEIIKIIAKSNTTLKCSEECNFYTKSHSKWQFKACSSDIRNVPCEKYYESAYQPGNKDRWPRVHATHSKTSKCPCNLDIFNISRRNSGLYRVIVNNKIKRVYEVIVLDIPNNDDSSSKIVINPKNITVPTNTELVIRCSVKNPSSIMWFKETDASGYDIMYDGHYYSKLSTTIYPNHDLESTEYQSKLSIHKAGFSDSGVYVCVGVNGDSIKTEVNIVTVIGYNWESHTSSSLLFLIPLAFALIPIIAWLCYYRMKRKDNNQYNQEQRKKLMLISSTLPSSNV